MQVTDAAQIPHCHGCGCSCSYSSYLTSSLGTSICCGCCPKKTKKKREKERKKENVANTGLKKKKKKCPRIRVAFWKSQNQDLEDQRQPRQQCSLSLGLSVSPVSIYLSVCLLPPLPADQLSLLQSPMWEGGKWRDGVKTVPSGRRG